MSQEKNESYPVKRGRFDSLTIYDVTSQELKIIETGSTNSIYLNFAIFLLSVSSSFFVSVFTVEWFPEETNQKQHLISFIIFLIIAVLTLLIGVICGFLWYRSHDSFKGTIKTIKQRLKEEIKENPNDDESVDIEVVEK